MNRLNIQTKSTGDRLEASEWNQVVNKINELVDSNSEGGGGSSTPIDTSGILSAKTKNGFTNVTLGNNNIKNVNIEPGYPCEVNGESKYGDIALKPGDDIQFCSHHREAGKQDKVIVKNIDGDDNPVKLEVHAGEMSLCTKGKNLTLKEGEKEKQNPEKMFDDDSEILNLNIITGNTLINDSGKKRDERGYLKVRARAIDLRCEKHGGIALQPKGYDSDGNMNKIKFEHGGGDGLEFGTFNTEKSSLYTDEYRFKRDGIWKMATRQTIANSKAVYDDNTPAGKSSTAEKKYVKQADDFYDIIDSNDEQCTTKDIIKTAFALNGAKDRHTKITNKGAIEIATNPTYTVVIEETPADPSTAIEISNISTKIAALTSVAAGSVFNEGDFISLPINATIYTNGTQYFSFTEVVAPSIKIESGSELKLGGILDFGSSFNFGETDNGIEVQYKLTKKNAEKDCGILKVVGVNNHASNNLTVEGITIAPGESSTITQCSILDIIKLVNYMKTNNQGPWAA